MADDTSSPGLSSPYDTIPSRQIRSTADPSATAYRVRGLATPCATSTTGPPDAFASERPWASPFKDFSSIAIGTPLGAHTLLTFTHRTNAPPRGDAARCGRLQGLVLATSSCCHRNHEWFRPSIPSWGSTFQSLLTFDLTLALIAASPLSPSGGLTSRPARASGYCGANEWGDPSPDRQLS